MEQTLSIIKPDAVERNLIDEIKNFFIKKNLKILKSKKVKISREEASDKISLGFVFLPEILDNTLSMSQHSFNELVIKLLKS